MSNLNFRRPLSRGFNNVAFWIIGINIVVFIIMYTANSGRLFINLALSVPGLKSGRIWQLVTYMFVHGNPQHLFFNMLGLFFFGVQVERTMGSREFLVFYLLTGMLSGLVSFLIYTLTGANTILLGASGAIFAVLFGFAMYYPNAKVLLFFVLPLRSIYLVLLYTGIEIFSHFRNPHSGVGHLAHLAGFAFAYLYFLLRLKINPIDIFRGPRNRRYH